MFQSKKLLQEQHDDMLLHIFILIEKNTSVDTCAALQLYQDLTGIKSKFIANKLMRKAYNEFNTIKKETKKR